MIMKKEDKQQVIAQIKELMAQYSHFYITDIAGLDAARTHKLRKVCFKQDIKLVVVKNTLLQKTLESSDTDFSVLFDVLKGNTALLFSNNGNAPARLIKEMKQDKANNNKPELKAAYAQECFYVGADQLDALCTLKSKEELLGDIIGMLQSPMQQVLSALQSGGNTIHGVLKTLGERAE